MTASAIGESLELAAERAGDITPLVYDKLFARHPDMLPLFVRDKTGQVRGEMLARTIDVILDVTNGNAYGENFVRCEVVTHDGYGVPRDVFPAFFEAIADTLREILGPDWSSDMARAWTALLLRFNALCDRT
ncbi:MAG TPA: globin [Rhizomicrobium sp.]|nr:globin [Rhizomicrobium sp.]